MRATIRKSFPLLPLLLLAACQVADSRQAIPTLRDTTIVVGKDTIRVFGGIDRRYNQIRRVVIDLRQDRQMRDKYGQRVPPQFLYRDTARRESQNPVYAAPGDLIIWRADDGPWAVHHGPLTPFRVLRIHGRPSQWAGAQVRADATFGKYRYFVAVEIGDTIWMDDPDDMIGPEK